MAIRRMILLAHIAICTLGAQTTGKIAGTVIDASTQEPLIGANVFLVGTPNGAATNAAGEYYIINVSPGLYILSVQMIGYTNYQVQDLRVSVNRTSTINAALSSAVIGVEEIVVQANRISLKKDQTGSIRNVSSDQISALAVENLSDVINMQAGVVDGHFRGGRKNEVSFMIDGIRVIEPFGGENIAVTVEPEMIEDIEIISGTFNAEYGRAMSGIVNAVTKTGGTEFHGSVSSSAANYLTENGDIFIGLDDGDLDRQKDLKFQFSGPLLTKRIGFLFNVRSRNSANYLNGINRFVVDDYSNFAASDSNSWVSSHNGDSEVLPLSYSALDSYMGKLNMQLLQSIKLSLLFTRNDEEWGDYSHGYKYNPDGRPINYKNSGMVTFKVNHMLSSRMFYDLNLSYIDNYNGRYVFENPLDSNYVHESYYNDNGPGFYTGGQDKNHERRTIIDNLLKFDYTWQVNSRHMIKTGALYTSHDISHEWHSIRNLYETLGEDENDSYFDAEAGKVVFPNYAPTIYSDASIYTDQYNVVPIEFAWYFQDKMEFEQMVINAGIRYDYFDPNTTYPSVQRNPANQLTFTNNPEKMSVPLETDPQVQISPRLGLSYQLGDAAVLHFSYGHFFQMPPMYALYQNHSQLIAPNDYVTTTGNPNLEAQKTIQYEVGLWQELIPGMGLEVVVFYRDIYNLLSTKIVSTFNQIQYGLYTNKDYGNSKGLEVKWDFQYAGLSTNLNYALQYTRGNADNPEQTFNRAGDSRDPIPTLIPMSWDQRHTLNLTVGYRSPRFGLTATGYYNSGQPYTWSPLSDNRVANINLYPNNAYQRTTATVDLNGSATLLQANNTKVTINFTVYNLLDKLNDNWVDNTTGRAYTSIVQQGDLNGHHSNFNEYADRVHNPNMYRAPRLVKVGLGVSF